jgi:Domain of unknown function (DUF1906)
MNKRIKTLFIALSFGFTAAQCVAADPVDEGRIAIVDISYSLISEKGEPDEATFKQLRDSGVLVIGRYMSRCQQFDKQGKLWRKRLVDGPTADTEAKAVVAHDFAILSIYQYNNRADKFTGRFSGRECITSSHEDDIRKATSPQAREGILDAEAALQQADAIHQPPQTVIYFGVDYFYPENPKSNVERDGVLAYFEEIKKQFDLKGYRIGAYAGGDVLKLLLGDNPKHKRLIDVAWIAPSASYPGSSDFHTHGPWDLFQSEADNATIVSNGGKCSNGISYDTNIQNVAAADKDLGFWDKNGLFKVPGQRTQAIFDQRRFICDRRNLRMPAPATSCGGPVTTRSCEKSPTNGEPCFDRTVRVKPGQTNDNLQVDFHEYGAFDYTVPAWRLTGSLRGKPLYEHAPWDTKLCPNVPAQ